MNWRERLEAEQILLADGGWGTQLMARGLPAGACPELWNVEQPANVRAVAEAYVQAGSDLILTNSFGGSRPKLAHVGAADRVVELNRAAAAISREAAGDRALAFGSVGPTGEFVEPLGTLTTEEMTAIFAEQIGALVAGGVDGIVIETMLALEEAACAVQAARRVTDLPVVASITFEPVADGSFVNPMGVRPAAAAEFLQAQGVDLIGSNCGTGGDSMVTIITQLRAVTGLPLWAKPNAGVPELVHGQTVFRETPAQTAAHFGALVAAGARIIGGCCGTCPETIRQLVVARDHWRASA